ncbi:BTB/POZ domain-containing protein [Drosera capensis]
MICRIGWQLEEASVSGILIRAQPGESMMYDVDTVLELFKEYVVVAIGGHIDPRFESDFDDIKKPRSVSNASRGMVLKLVEFYLAELPISKFITLAELVTGFSRLSHDGLYCAIDTFLKEHPRISKSERKRICRLVDRKKLSAEACFPCCAKRASPNLSSDESHHIVLHGCKPGPLLWSSPSNVRSGSLGSSRSATTNTEDDWDGVPTSEELKALKGEISALRVGEGPSCSTRSVKQGPRSDVEKAAENKVRGSKKLFSRLWSGKEREGENSSSDTSGSPGSSYVEEVSFMFNEIGRWTSLTCCSCRFPEKREKFLMGSVGAKAAAFQLPTIRGCRDLINNDAKADGVSFQ